MTIRRLRNKKISHETNTANSRGSGQAAPSNSKRFEFRKSLIETLESRQLMAVGPRLIGIQPNNSDLIENGVIRNIAPRELTFRFDDAQVLDAATTRGIRLTRAGGDGSFALPSVSTDFGSDGRVDIQLTARNAADFLTINITSQNLGAAGPQLSINGQVVSIVLNSNPSAQVTAQQLVDAINSSQTLSPRLGAKINGGLGSARLGGGDSSRFVPAVMRSDNDIVIQPGAVIIGDRPNENEVTLRFADNLPDDFYRIEVFGFDDAGRGIRGLRNTNGDFFVPSVAGTRQDTIEFRLDLGSKITGVVPQPVVRDANGTLVQLRDTIIVYFDEDKLVVENDANGNPTSRSVENPEFYQLIYTSDTVRNTDDAVFLPVSVRYNASANTATLRYNDDIERLAGPFAPAATYRLRVGTRESRPMTPVRSEAAATAILDMNSGGRAKLRFVSRVLGEAGSGFTVNFVNSNSQVPANPTVTINGRTITVDLMHATTTVRQVIEALETSAASTLIRTTLEPGSDGNFVVGNRPINYQAVLYPMGDTFETASNLGTIGSANVPQTSLILTSDIEANIHRLDLPGAPDDIGQRVVPEPFENHINPQFTADNFAGIRTILYNFRSDYAGAFNLSNAITAKQKERIREALALWSRQLGVQFVETESSGMTFALGETSVLPQTNPGNANFRVRIDPSYNNSLAIFSASTNWENEYGEGFTRSAAASIGLLLGLSYAGDLEPDSLMSFDNGFINFPAGADRNFEPIFPGVQDTIHGQYLHRPEGSDIDLYKFDIDFGPDGASRQGVFVAETFAERSNNGSPLDTRLALYKEVQASALSNLGAGQGISVQFTAVRPGILGNNLQVFVTRSPRGANQPPLVQAFPNAVSIDLNSSVGHETTLDQFIKALDDNPAARSLVKVQKLSGLGSTVLGSRSITYSPITLRGGRVDLIAQNDNYFSRDSLIRMNLDSGVYYIGVSSTGNDKYDPTIPGTGTGGRTQGRYDLRLNFRAQTDGSDAISDVGVGNQSIALNGDADSVSGGVFDYWFETRRQFRTFRFNSGGSASLEGKTITLTGADGTVRRFEFSSDTTVGTGNTRIPYSITSSAIDLARETATAINSRSELNIVASASGDTVSLRGERLLQFSPNLQQVDVLGKTIYVDKSAGPNADGSLERPFNSISGLGVPNAFSATFPGDIVRIVANGGVDGQIASVRDNLAFEIGFGSLPGVVLADGPTMDVPKGVNVMIDPGVIFKLNRARIGVGSSTIGVDRSGGALQVLGAPILLDARGNAIKMQDGKNAPGSVYFTSWFDESIGLDSFLPSTTPAPGDWGGLVFKRDVDRSVGRFDLEDEGIFRQYVNYADIRYGGSNAVVVDSAQRTVNSLEIYDMRPTISFNRITSGSGNAMLATPDSFEETLFSEPIYQRKGEFTPDYDRVGPHIHDNTLLNNSINGLFISVSTPAGGSIRQLTVPGRFDDIDVVHVMSENLAILGQPGGSLLDQFTPPTTFVSLQPSTGGTLLPGTYNYKITFVDRYGYETPPSNPTNSVNLVQGQTAIRAFGLPSVSGEYVTRRVYRSDSGGGGSYRLIAELDGNSSSFIDIGQQPGADEAVLRRDRPNVSGVSVIATPGSGNLPINTYTYRIVMIDAVGREGLASNPTASVTTQTNLQTVRLTNLPPVPEGFVSRRIYRASGSTGQYILVAESPANSSSFVDTGGAIGTPLSVESLGNVRPTLSASLTVDPGAILKLEGARIELGHSAHMIAEGTVENRIVFTSKLDDRFGAGGTFDTNNNGFRPSGDAARGDWSGIYASPGAKLNLDHGVFAYAGGVSRIEGTIKAFSPIELQQADARIAHITFENNANGIGGQGPIDRLGRPANENYPPGNNASRGSTLFIRGTQPIVLGNVFQNNAGTAITIDINSMDAKIRGDQGRQSGMIERDLTIDSNRGPLFRRNRLFNNGINGLEVRADASTNNRAEGVLAVRDLQRNSLSTESVWDDTDIVHVLFDSVTVSNLQHSGGLRLQSAINESLVIKLEGQGSNFDQERGTGFTATGRYGSIEGRVGGTIHVLGQPNFPVIFTSLRDDTVGAGTQPDGLPQTDTNNDGIATIPRPGDWRSLLFDTYSNDRNVRVAMELESPNVVAPGINDVVITAQFLGALATNPSKSDENLPLGYVVHGVVSEPTDQDVYSFTAEAGTEVWFDVDDTSSSLDSVIELLDANGSVLARSESSTNEQTDPSTIVTTALIDRFNVNPLVKRNTPGARRNASGLLKDDGTINEKDAGFRILLPGVAGAQSTYFFRIRSSATNIDNNRAGLTKGSYTVQIRLRDTQEYAGSIVQHADVRYATNGVQANGLPSRSPLTGEAKVGMYDGTLFHQPVNGTYVGSLHQTDLQAISVAGTIQGGLGTNVIRFHVGQVANVSGLVNLSELVGQPSFTATYPVVLDIDYADGLNRPDLQMQLFDSFGNLIASNSSSSVFDDQPGPLRGSDLADLSRGSVGTGDPLIKVNLRRGEYRLVVSSQGPFSGSGAYQLEIRAGDRDPNLLRGAFGTSINIPAGLVIPDKSVMEMSDGANRVRFQFTYDGSFDFGNTPIQISASSSAAQIARALRDAINSMFLQSRWRISAANSNGIATGDAGNNTLLHLVGNVDFLSGASLLGANAIIISEGRGDVNVQRDQGQFIVTNSTFTHIRDFAVWSAPADKQYADGLARQPHFINEATLDYNYVAPPTLGGAYARNLPVLNEVPFGVAAGSVAERAGVAPGMVVSNNVFDSSGLGGLHVQGEPPIWRVTSFPGALDRVQNANATGDHSGSFIDDGDELLIDFQRQSAWFEFEDISGAGTGTPNFGSGVVGGNGLRSADRIMIAYREDTGGQYMRPPNAVSGDGADDVIKHIHGAILGSPLVTNGTTQRLDAWVEPADPFNFAPTSTLILRGPQSVQFRNFQGLPNPFQIERIGEYTAAPFVRAVNNTIIGNDGRAPFTASTVDAGTNSTIATAIETWQGVGINPPVYTINGNLPPDPLSTGSSAVDLYKFHMEIASRVRINLQNSGGLATTLRIFDANGVAQDVGGVPDPTIMFGTAIDYFALKPGDYYLGISASGNDRYDPLSFADRNRGSSSGSYRLSLEVLKTNNFLITVDDAASYAGGETFTIEQVSDFPGVIATNSRTFQIVLGGNDPGNGNIPVYIGPEYRVQDVARAIAGAINNAGMNNIVDLPNGAFGDANPLAPVSAIAINGENGFDPNRALPRNASNPDVGINSGAARGAQLQAGLNRYRQGQNDFSPVDLLVSINGNLHETGTHRGFGHDRTFSLPVFPSNNGPITATGQGTTEKYVIVRNAHAIRWSGRRVEGQRGTNNLNQLLPETGIFVSGGASPTLMNNVFVNVQSPVIQERPSYPNPGPARAAVRPSAVIVAGATYQHAESASQQTWLGIPLEAVPTNVPNTANDFNQIASGNEILFVNLPGDKFLPGRGTRIIDSSIDSLPEREGFRAVKQAIGIAPSPILAPDRDLNGVLRADDPSVAPPNGLGGNIFKDRGALERADFIGPTAVILNPIDNDAQQVDTDTTVSVIDLKRGVYPEFRIQLKDGFENANLGGGTGINDASVIGRLGGNRLPGSAVTITENGRLLVEGVDYVFSYDETTDEIVLKPLAGIWKNDRVYDISLNNRDRFVIDAASGDVISDGEIFTVRDSFGGAVTFEYDSGYRLQIPQGIQLQVPIAGGGAGGVVDGDRFIVNTPTGPVIFEFDSNGNFISGQTPIAFNTLSTKRNIAEAIVQALSSIPGLRPRLLPNNDVFVGAVAGVSVDTRDTPSISQPNSTLALLVPALGTRPGGITDGQSFVVSDGRTSVVFEFDSDSNIAPGNVRVNIADASTANDVARVLKSALDSAGLSINATIIGGSAIHLALSNAGRVDLINTNLSLVGISRALADGDRITITRTTSAGTISRTFEFTLDSQVAPGSIPVSIGTADTQSEIGVALALAIEGSGLGLSPRHVGDGNVFLGGTAEYSVSVQNAPTVGLFGRPGVRDNSTLEIFGTLLMQLPVRGGVDIPEDSTFTISANSRTVTFEFDSNFSGPSLPNNVIIRYTPTITAADLVTNMIPIIRNAGLGLTPRDAGGGRIDLGLLPTGAVNPFGSGITLSRGNVSDGDFFTINNGTTSVTFEFENLSIGNGRNPAHTPIRYNNQSSRQDVLQAMKAAIESSTLGLTTQINSVGLRLLDNPRFTVNVDNAPSLRLNGVPGGAIPVSFVQDQSFGVIDMRNAIIRAINKANQEGKTSLFAKVRGGSTLFVENAVTVSPEIASFYLRGITDNADNFLKSNRINGETQFTILMPGIEKDYGDSPDPVSTTPGRYPTLREFDGARHVVIQNGVRFGTGVSTESDGRLTPLADGDSNDDGISFQFQDLARPMFNRFIDNSVTVTLSSAGFVDAWIDFNADGDWADPGEQVIKNVEFTNSTLVQTFSVRVPATFPIPASGVNSFARFRVSSAGNHLPTGLALDGEVEDYLVRIVPGVPPEGVADRYSLDEDQIGGLTTSDSDGTATPGFVVDDGVLANDRRLDGRPLKAEFVSFGGNGTLEYFRTDGTFKFVPSPDFFGTTTIVYRPFIVLDEGRGEILRAETLSTATIIVRPVNDPPTAQNFNIVTDKNTPISLTQLEVFAATRADAKPGPANESSQTLTLSLPNNVSSQSGSVSVTGGVLTYTPRTNFSGTDTFAFTVTDNGVTGDLFDPRSITRTVTVTVNDRNEPPVTTPKSISIDEDTSYDNTISFFMQGDSPVEPNQTLTFTGVAPLSLNGGVVEFRDGRVFYTPRANHNGTDEFFYFVTDNGTTAGQPDFKTSRGTVSVTIQPVNDPPVRIGSSMGTQTMLEDAPERTLDLTAFFTDPDILTNRDELTFSVANTTNASLLDINFVGSNMFIRPRPDANGTAVITVSARDKALLSVTSNLTVVVTPVADAPRLVTPLPNLTVQEDQVVAPIVLSPTYFFDPDVINGDVLTYSVVVSNPALVSAAVVNGELRLTLVQDASGIATITVFAKDSSNTEISDSFDIIVTPVNDAPRTNVTGIDSYIVPLDSRFQTTDPTGNLTAFTNDNGVLANDIDPERNPMIARLVRGPLLGNLTLNPDGTFFYQTNSAATVGATDSFVYEAVDSLNAVSVPTTVQIRIARPLPSTHRNPVNHLDVDADGFVSPIDVLEVVNFINARGSSVPVAGLSAPPPYLDVDGDKFVSPLDVLEIIVYLNERGNSGGEGEGEAEGEGEGLTALMDSQLVMPTHAPATCSGTTTTLRDNTNVGVALDVPVVGPALPAMDSDVVQMSLADYLASLEEDDESVAQVLASSGDEDTESLDAFFAESFLV